MRRGGSIVFLTVLCAGTLLTASESFAAGTKDGVTFAGKAVDANGQPVSAAKVYLCSWHRATNLWRLAATAKTDREGRFLFEHVNPRRASYGRYQLLAFKSGLAWAGKLVRSTDPLPARVTLALLPRAQIRGRIIDHNNKAVAGAEVGVSVRLQRVDETMRFRSAAGLVATGTGEDGSFALTNLPDGSSCALSVMATGYATEPGWVGPVGSTAGIRAPAADVEIRLTPEVTLPGRLVHHKTGNGVAGVGLKAQGAGPRSRGWATTGARGRFVFRGLRPGEHKIYAHDLERGVLLPGDPVQVGRGGPHEDLLLKWHEGIPVSLRVLDSATGQPVRWASVTFRPRSPSGRETVGDVMTTQDGIANANVRPSEFRAAIGAEGYMSRNLFGRDLVSAIPVSGKPFDVPVDPYPKCRLTVVDAEGRPVSGAKVSDSRRMLGRTDKAGKAVLTLRPGFRTVWRVESADGRLAAMIREPGRETHEFQISLNQTIGIQGLVVDDEKRPVAGATVSASHMIPWGDGSYGGLPIATVKTDDEGRYRFDGVTRGSPVQIEVLAEGFGSATTNVDIREASVPVVVAEELKLSAAEATIRGRVVDPNGRPLEDAEISLGGRATPPQSARSGKDGSFQFEKVVSEQVYLYVERRDHRPASLRIGPDEFKNIVVEMLPMRRVNGGLSRGDPAPAVEGVGWIQGDWPGLQSLKGRHVVLVFVALRNRTCLRVVRQLVRAQKSMNSKVVVVHDASLAADDIRTIAKREGLGFPIARPRSERYHGWYSDVFMAYRVSSVPTLILIGPDGAVIDGDLPMQDAIQTIQRFSDGK